MVKTACSMTLMMLPFVIQDYLFFWLNILLFEWHWLPKALFAMNIESMSERLQFQSKTTIINHWDLSLTRHRHKCYWYFVFWRTWHSWTKAETDTNHMILCFWKYFYIKIEYLIASPLPSFLFNWGDFVNFPPTQTLFSWLNLPPSWMAFAWYVLARCMWYEEIALATCSPKKTVQETTTYLCILIFDLLSNLAAAVPQRSASGWFRPAFPILTAPWA